MACWQQQEHKFSGTEKDGKHYQSTLIVAVALSASTGCNPSCWHVATHRVTVASLLAGTAVYRLQQAHAAPSATQIRLHGDLHGLVTTIHGAVPVLLLGRCLEDRCKTLASASRK
jgi:hypothetical protein